MRWFSLSEMTGEIPRGYCSHPRREFVLRVRDTRELFSPGEPSTAFSSLGPYVDSIFKDLVIKMARLDLALAPTV